MKKSLDSRDFVETGPCCPKPGGIFIMSEEQYGPKNTPDFKNFDQNKEQILWKDRKRILGMPISFTRYAIDENSLISRIGLFRTTTNDILLYRILDIKMQQSLGQKMFEIGRASWRVRV